MSNAIRLKTAQPSRQAGERARVRVASGPDSGVVFVITGPSVMIGRGEECDIMLTDLKTSRKHVQILNDGFSWKVKDLGSANGITLNGSVVKSQEIRSQDQIELGDTRLLFLTSDLSTQILNSPLPKTLDPLVAAKDLQNYQARRAEVASLGSVGVFHPRSSVAASSSQSRPLIVVVALGVIGWVLFSGSDETSKRVKPGDTRTQTTVAADSRDLASYLPSQNSTQMKRDADAFFQFGFREYREKNYLRAKQQFETVLQISPGHSLARTYLAATKKEIDEEIDFHLQRGKRAEDIGKTRESKAHYEAIIRLLSYDKLHPAYSQADEALKKLEKIKERGGG